MKLIILFKKKLKNYFKKINKKKFINIKLNTNYKKKIFQKIKKVLQQIMKLIK